MRASSLWARVKAGLPNEKARVTEEAREAAPIPAPPPVSCRPGHAPHEVPEMAPAAAEPLHPVESFDFEVDVEVPSPLR